MINHHKNMIAFIEHDYILFQIIPDDQPFEKAWSNP